MSYLIQPLQISQQKTTGLTRQWLKQILFQLLPARRRQSGFRQLRHMPEHMLRDIGLTRADIETLDEESLAARRIENLKRAPGKGSNF